MITIQQADFEAFAALDMDSATTNVKHKRGGETEFGQEIPAMSSFESKPGPPILPPHLLQVSCLLSYQSVIFITNCQGDPEQGYATFLRTNSASRAKSCDDQPPLCSEHQGRRDGDQLDAEVPQEICHHPPLQADRGLDRGECYLVRCHTHIFLYRFMLALNMFYQSNAFVSE